MDEQHSSDSVSLASLKTGTPAPPASAIGFRPQKLQLHQGDLHWDDTARDAPYLTLDHSIRTDVLIIGGGMSGALIAHTLAEQGYELAVIDRAVPGYGSSDGNTGIVQYCSDKSLAGMIEDMGQQAAVDFYRLSLEAMERLGTIARSLPENVGYSPAESLKLAAGPGELERLRTEYQALQDHGFPARLLDSGTLRERYGLEAQGALLTEGDAMLNPFRMVQALHRFSLGQGTPVYRDTEAIVVTEAADGFRVLTAGGQEILARRVILATGYTPGAYPPIEEAVELNTTFSLVTETLPPDLPPLDAMVWDSADPYLYFRRTEDNRIIAGGRDREGTTLTDSAGIRAETDRIREQIGTYWPAFGDTDIGIQERWQSVFGISKDGLPFIGRDARNPDLYFAMGYGGNGTCYSVMAALILAEFLSGREYPGAYTTSWPRRFGT